MTTPWRRPAILGVGEAMVEFAPLEGGGYRQGFAGDTLNTCWHLAALLGARAEVGYFTRVGSDAFSQRLLAFLGESGIDAAAVTRDPERSLGLYVISLDGVERSFSYWRETSAARRLADDPGALAAAFARAGLLHVSGITLAVIGEAGRAHLFAALAQARREGARVSFDPNLRPALWPGLDTLRAATQAMLALTDIALPSFDDEARAFGDADPDATLARLEAFGVAEIVVKDGPGEVRLSADGVRGRVATPPVSKIRDTTGAGDAFNAGYLAGRFVGLPPAAAVALGQKVAAAALGAHGALASRAALTAIKAEIPDA